MRGRASAAATTEEFVPIAVADLELTAGFDDLPAADEAGVAFSAVHVLVRLHGQPLGFVRLPAAPGGFSAERVRQAVWSQLAGAINAHLERDGLPPVAAGETPPAETAPVCQDARRAAVAAAAPASVLICTKDRPDVIADALASVARLEYPRFETIVVDGSRGDETAEIVARFPDVRYVRIDWGGLVYGRNRAMAEARGEFLAFTDDDAVVDPHWLPESIAGFDAAGHVACVTGLAVPAELRTQAQLWFEESGAFVDGFTPRTVDLRSRDRRSLLPYATGKIGAGVSMTWRASVLAEIGGFDPILDACGAEDLASFFDALCAGYAVSFRPGAIVHHIHRRTYEELRAQIRSHARGLGAYLVRCVVTQPGRTGDLLVRVPRGLAYGFDPRSKRHEQKPSDFPRELTLVEIPGFMSGPAAYVKGRRLARSRARARTPQTR